MNSAEKGQHADGCGERHSGSSPHTFHIPVMGTGFTVDSPLKVARYGISTVMSIGDDILLEQMRKFHCEKNGIEFDPISTEIEDYRSKRITAYLNLVHYLVNIQIQQLQSSPFEPGSEITRYFEMLPDSQLRNDYKEMLATTDPDTRAKMESELRRKAVPGSMDVNIMAKIDGDRYRKGVKLPPEDAVAMSAFRGFAQSTLSSSVVFSAGFNRRLYAYIAQFDDFFADENGRMKKKIVLKVSDFRSATIQGKMLAGKGLWVSEYRIESGLNCGGHAFATNGHLMGSILEEFKRNRAELSEKLFKTYARSLKEMGRRAVEKPPETRVTVQGGIGTAEEDGFLHRCYEVDATGWGTPFLLVPEVTNVDAEHVRKLAEADANDVHLSLCSPVGIPFWGLKDSTSEETRVRRIKEGKPGSPCPKGYLGFSTEFSQLPICTASAAYQKMKLDHIVNNGYSREQLTILTDRVLSKTCICVDLTGGAMIKNNIQPNTPTAVCSGPGIADFSKVTSLEKMVDHIYGRVSLITNPDRPQMFMRELGLYVDYVRGEMADSALGLLDRSAKYFADFRQNLSDGIDYYRELAQQFEKEKKESFLKDLEEFRMELDQLFAEMAVAPAT